MESYITFVACVIQDLKKKQVFNFIRPPGYLRFRWLVIPIISSKYPHTIYSQYPTHDIHLKLVCSSDGGIDNSKAALPQLASKLVQLADDKDGYDFHLKTL